MAVLSPQKAFLGVGWSFPPAVSKNGRTAIVAYDDDIRQSIRIILGTDQGERVMRPDFGAGLRSFVFGSISATALHTVRTRVQNALVEWEPRIDVEQVTVDEDSEESSKLNIRITYRVRATNTLNNLVFPFYLQEGNGQ
jgi:Bacteriophage baseplate protein W